jgi:signal transduction histidine kinase
MTRGMHSLRLRFLFASVLWVSVATAIAGVVISSLYRTHTTEQYRHDLTGHLKELAMLTTVGPDGRPALQRPMSDPRFREIGSGYYWQIQEGEVATAKSATLGKAMLAGAFATGPRARSGWNAGPDGQALELGVMQTTQGSPVPLRYSIAIDRRLIDDAIARFNRDLAISLSIFGLLMIGGATAQITYGLRPVKRIGDDIDRLRRGTLARLPTEVPTEFAPLVTRMNALLDTQASVVQRARVAAGNLAHGLRTPLALIGSEVEQLAKVERDKADFILSQCDRMKRQIDYHMSRAGAAGTRVTGTVTDVGDMVRQIVDVMRRLHLDRRLTFMIDIPGAIDVSADPEDLFEILSNLIDNASKWAESTVAIGATALDGRIVVDIIDDGPGIPKDKRASVFDVGMRLDETREGGGLGLAISADLAALYGGSIELGEARLGGLLARLTLRSFDPA